MRAGRVVILGRDYHPVRGREYTVLLTLALIWGASFLFIKLAVLEVSPATLATVRVGGSVLTLSALTVFRPKLFAGGWRFWRLSLAVGFINYVIPYIFIAWGETHISSGMASILNATTPLFTVLLANWWAKPGYEALNVRRGLGVVSGFVGVGVLVGPQLWGDVGGGKIDLLGLAAVLVAAAAYAVGALLSRGYAGSAQLVGPLGSQIGALIVLLPIALLGNAWLALRWNGTWSVQSLAIHWDPPTHLPSLIAIGSMVELGVLGTAAAYLLYFWLIRHVGATRATIVTYLLPCTALVWGVLLLGETVSWYALAGLALVLLGTMVTNGTFNGLFARGKSRAGAAAAETVRES